MLKSPLSLAEVLRRQKGKECFGGTGGLWMYRTEVKSCSTSFLQSGACLERGTGGSRSRDGFGPVSDQHLCLRVCWGYFKCGLLGLFARTPNLHNGFTVIVIFQSVLAFIFHLIYRTWATPEECR